MSDDLEQRVEARFEAWKASGAATGALFGLDRSAASERLLGRRVRPRTRRERVTARLRAVWRAIRGWYDE